MNIDLKNQKRDHMLEMLMQQIKFNNELNQMDQKIMNDQQMLNNLIYYQQMVYNNQLNQLNQQMMYNQQNNPQAMNNNQFNQQNK